MNDWFRVGLVSTAHGIKGALRIFPTTDDMTRFRALKQIWLSKSEEYSDNMRLLTVKEVSFLKSQVILQTEEITDRNEAELLRGGSLWIPRSEAVELSEDEFYFADFIDAKVVTDTGEALGTVKDIFSTGSNEVLEVRMPDGKEVLIPVIKDCIVKMDAPSATVTVHMLEGLL